MQHTLLDVTGIVKAGMCQAQLMMGMPLADVLEAKLAGEEAAYPFKVLKVLIEKGMLMVGVIAWAKDVKHNRDARRGPIAKQLSARLNIRVIKDIPRKIIQLTLKDDDRIWRTGNTMG
jgi:hypothetical protein